MIFSFIIIGVAAVFATDDSDLFTDPLIDPSANANDNAIPFYNTLLEPSFVDKSSSLASMPPDLVASGDIFINPSDDSNVGEGFDLLDEEVESELLASSAIGSVPLEDCSVVPLPFRSRRRRRRKDAQPLQCTSAETQDEPKPYFRNFREMAGQSAHKISNFDASQCLGPLPYLICSSNIPYYTVYWPGILSWMLYESSRGMSQIIFWFILLPFIHCVFG